MAFQLEDTQKKVKAIIAEKLKLPVDQIALEASFKELGADSLDSVDMIMSFEEDFGMEIKDEEAEKIITVNDAVSFIQTNRKK